MTGIYVAAWAFVAFTYLGGKENVHFIRNVFIHQLSSFLVNIPLP